MTRAKYNYTTRLILRVHPAKPFREWHFLKFSDVIFICKYSVIDIDECLSGDHDCNSNNYCVNELKGYRCVCNHGYDGNGNNCSKFIFNQLLSTTLLVSCVLYLLFIHHVLYFAFFPACKDGDIRLVNGSSHREGRVEVCRNNVYGTICDDGWGLLDAQVICRSLNFSNAGIYS